MTILVKCIIYIVLYIIYIKTPRKYNIITNSEHYQKSVI